MRESFLSQMVNDMGKNIAAASSDKSEALLALYNQAMSLVEVAIAAEERMHAASLEANSNLLTSALKGAETVDADNFGALIGALKEVSLAGIEAQRAVHLESVANGRAAIKAMEGISNAAIGAFAPVAMAQAQAQATRAGAEMLTAETREREVSVKETNAKTEAKKAETARQARDVPNYAAAV